MRIERIELRLLHLPLVRHFETSFGRTIDRQFILVTVEDSGAVGIGECVADANPYYSAETTRTAWHIIAEFIAPIVLGRQFDHPREIFGALGPIRGHNMAKAAVEMAAWDLFARQQGQPLASVLGGTRTSIESGVSIGIQDSLDELVERVRVEREAGYRRVKIKIKPGWDVDAWPACARLAGCPLMVTPMPPTPSMPPTFRRSIGSLMMVEQPLDYDDLRDHATLQRRLSTPICLDESIHSVRGGGRHCDRRLSDHHRRAGGRSRPSIQLHDPLPDTESRSVWRNAREHHARTTSPSTLPNFTLPGRGCKSAILCPDVIDPAIAVAPDGTIAAPTGPGIGVQVVADRVAAATRERLELEH